jgi:hypothetical protein
MQNTVLPFNNNNDTKNGKFGFTDNVNVVQEDTFNELA